MIPTPRRIPGALRILPPAALLVVGVLTLVHRSAAQPGGGAKSTPPEAEQIGPERYRIGEVTVDLKAKVLTCKGSVNMRRGPIEYLAVNTRGEKRHESVLVLDARPRHFQLGLILLGLEAKGGLRHQGDTQPPLGSKCRVYVAWTRNGRNVRVPAEELAWDTIRGKPMESNPWVFSGSMIHPERGFLADEEGSLIATFRDPLAIINNALPTGSDDTVYKSNERILPPDDTPVTLTVTP